MKIHVSDENKIIMSASDKYYIKLLEKHITFEKLIKQSRKNIGLTNLLSNFLTPEIYSGSYEEAEKIVDLYNLPDSWVFSLQFFIVTGKFMPAGEGINLSGDSLKYSQSVDEFKPTPIEITITQRMSFRSLCDWIREHKPEIKRRLLNLPRKRKVPTKSLFKFKLEMFSLHQKGYSAKEIEKELNKKYPRLLNNQKIFYTNIQRWMREFKNALKGAPLDAKLK